MGMFLRESTVGREPLAVAMSGIRLGERVLQIGLGDARVTGALAAKPGLTGESAIVIADEAAADRARRAAADAGALVHVVVHSLERLPFEGGSFDVAVIHAGDRAPEAGSAPGAGVLRECRRVLRSGGRIVVLEAGTRTGLAGIFRARGRSNREAGATTRGLEAAGFSAVRILGDREGCRFIEGLKVDLQK
jgi:ubiquinone/menaquinone biosynthesis C-methylase UbiE